MYFLLKVLDGSRSTSQESELSFSCYVFFFFTTWRVTVLILESETFSGIIVLLFCFSDLKPCHLYVRSSVHIVSPGSFVGTLVFPLALNKVGFLRRFRLLYSWLHPKLSIHPNVTYLDPHSSCRSPLNRFRCTFLSHSLCIRHVSGHVYFLTPTRPTLHSDLSKDPCYTPLCRDEGLSSVHVLLLMLFYVHWDCPYLRPESLLTLTNRSPTGLSRVVRKPSRTSVVLPFPTRRRLGREREKTVDRSVSDPMDSVRKRAPSERERRRVSEGVWLSSRPFSCGHRG